MIRLKRCIVIIACPQDDRYFVCWSDENSFDTVTDGSLRHLVNKYRNGTLALKGIPEPLLAGSS
jgi:hypothetical protein